MGTFCGGLGDVVAGQAEVAKLQSTPQGQKDAALKLADITQRAFTDTAQKLTQLGPPGIADGNHVQDSALGFFTTAANALHDQRVQLAALDANDPSFFQKATAAAPGLGDTDAKAQEVISNKDLAPVFGIAPQCRQLNTTAGQR